jgi:general secretion pathway protein B
MSFILDALKKSETDRQRQTGPALFEVKVPQPKTGFPVWAIAIVALLVINMVIVGWLLLRRSAHGDEAAAQTPAAASQPAPTSLTNTNAGAGTSTVSPPVAAVPPPANTSAPPAQNNYSPQQAYLPTSAGQEIGPATQGMSRSAANTSRLQANEQPPVHMTDRDQNEPTLAGAARSAASADGASNNPDDYAPAQDAGSPIFKGHSRRGTESGLMLYQDLAVANGSNLPELRLDMHVYDPKPQTRFALINMQRVHEGDILKDGVRVEAITPDGVIMSHSGTRFLLPRE